MNKLLYFKEWLTIKEASKCLSNVFNEKVKSKDIYRLALSNKLVLSLHFVNSTYVEKGKAVNAPYDVAVIVNESFIMFDQQYQMVKAGQCYDLLNMHYGQLVIKKGCYGNSAVELKTDAGNKGIIVVDNKHAYKPYYYRLINEIDDAELAQATVAEGLPKDVLLVVKTQHLLDFIEHSKVSDNLEKPLHSKERTNLYKVIALLAEMNHLSPNKEFKVANIIKTYGDSIGFDCPSSHTIAKCLKEASHYLPLH